MIYTEGIFLTFEWEPWSHQLLKQLPFGIEQTEAVVYDFVCALRFGSRLLQVLLETWQTVAAQQFLESHGAASVKGPAGGKAAAVFYFSFFLFFFCVSFVLLRSLIPMICMFFLLFD